MIHVVPCNISVNNNCRSISRKEVVFREKRRARIESNSWRWEFLNFSDQKRKKRRRFESRGRHLASPRSTRRRGRGGEGRSGVEWGEGKRRGVGRRKGAPLLRPYFALFSDWRANVDPVPALDRAALPKLLTRIRDERQVRAVVTSSPRLRPSSHGAGHRNLCSKYNSPSPGIPGIPVNFILVFKNWGGEGASIRISESNATICK